MDYLRKAQAQFDIDEFPSDENLEDAVTIYEFVMRDTFKREIFFEKFRDKVVLVVNIAANCGLTENQYKKLTMLNEKFKERGFILLSFPCNQFGGLMPLEDGEEMLAHVVEAKANLGVIFEKIDVNGPSAHPFYQYLKARQPGRMGRNIKWNFTKFLIDRDGIPIERYAPVIDPMDIVKDIEKCFN